MAENKVSITEMTKTTSMEEKSFMGHMEEATAKTKVFRVLYLALELAARKTIADNFECKYSKNQFSRVDKNLQRLFFKKPKTDIGTFQVSVMKTVGRRNFASILKRTNWIGGKM